MSNGDHTMTSATRSLSSTIRWACSRSLEEYWLEMIQDAAATMTAITDEYKRAFFSSVRLRSSFFSPNSNACHSQN